MILSLCKGGFLPALAIPVSLLIAACGSDTESSGSGDITVVTTTTQLTDMAKNIAGERAEVVGLLAANSDPHDYEPKPSDAASLTEAELLVKSGGDLDAWADELAESSGTEAEELDVLDQVDAIEGDPHWWQDPANAVIAVGEIRDTLASIDPDGADDYEASAMKYIAEIEAADKVIAACMEKIPAEQRKLVTDHDALGYFAERYDIEVVGSTIPALTTQAQPSVGETAELIDLIREEGVKAIFPEAGLNADLEEAIAEDAGATVGGELHADALDEDGTPGDTYVGALLANANTMATGFSGGEVRCEQSG
jgi:ABC-type Zn uptake system ZnuABC Zn-binding protein ZnuA